MVIKNLQNQILGRGSNPGVLDRLKNVEASVRDIKDRLDQEMGTANAQMVKLRADVRDLRNFVNTSVSLQTGGLLFNTNIFNTNLFNTDFCIFNKFLFLIF